MSDINITVPNRRMLNKHFISEIATEPVSDFRISAGSKQGDNVMGTLLCLDVKTEKNEVRHLVVKSVLPMTGVIDKNVLTTSKFIAFSNTFDREVLFYKQIRPMFQNVLGEAEIFQKPEFISYFKDESYGGLYDYLTLEDLRPSGYKMVDKFRGLNFEEMAATMKQLAIFHATSYALLNSKSNSIKNEDFVGLQKDPKSSANQHGWAEPPVKNGLEYRKFYNSLIYKMAEIVKEQGELSVAQKMEEYSKVGYDMLMKSWNMTESNGTYFRVLIHGDLWTNNVLIQYDPDGRTVKNVKFIDFQMIRFGNIYEELHYFIYTSTTAEFRKSGLKQCFHIYFQQFQSTLEKLSCEMPTGFTEKSLVETFFQNVDYGFTYNLVAMPFQLGIQPPPPSPTTPMAFPNSNAESERKFFNEEVQDKSSKPEAPRPRREIDAIEFEPNFWEMMTGMEAGLVQGMRNSEIGLQRLRELIEEMKELGLV